MLHIYIFNIFVCRISITFLFYWSHTFYFFSSLQFAIERPTETVMLLSLTGVRSIIANQWYTTLQENAESLEILLESKYLYSSLSTDALFQMFVFILLMGCVYLFFSPFSTVFAPWQILPGVSRTGKQHAGHPVLLTG